MQFIRFFFCSLIVLIPRTIHAQAFTTEEAFPALRFDRPVDLQNANNGSNKLYVVEQAGKIKSFLSVSSVSQSDLLLNITDRVLDDGAERGLLGLTFHPNFNKNGFLFVNYTRQPDGATIISRFQVTNGIADPTSELIILKIKQPFSNHNGGQIRFGPDGYLYISVGDGGSAGDPNNNAQNKNRLLGKILRIDVNRSSSRLNYAIPSDNPFVGKSKVRKEIFAYGLRNPWRFSFDSATNLLWAGDVGQDKREEIDIIAKGKNYGWRLFEGPIKFNCTTSACRTTRVTKPIDSYSHALGSAVTAGFVYHGTRLSSLRDLYIFGDFVSGIIFSLSTKRPFKHVIIAKTSHLISSFGLDEGGELYLCDYGTGKIFSLTSTAG